MNRWIIFRLLPIYNRKISIYSDIEIVKTEKNSLHFPCLHDYIDAFLSHLAIQGQVSASTQRQALNAIIFLYRQVQKHPIEDQLV